MQCMEELRIIAENVRIGTHFITLNSRPGSVLSLKLTFLSYLLTVLLILTWLSEKCFNISNYQLHHNKIFMVNTNTLPAHDIKRL